MIRLRTALDAIEAAGRQVGQLARIAAALKGRARGIRHELAELRDHGDLDGLQLG